MSSSPLKFENPCSVCGICFERGADETNIEMTVRMTEHLAAGQKTERIGRKRTRVSSQPVADGLSGKGRVTRKSKKRKRRDTDTVKENKTAPQPQPTEVSESQHLIPDSSPPDSSPCVEAIFADFLTYGVSDRPNLRPDQLVVIEKLLYLAVLVSQQRLAAKAREDITPGALFREDLQHPSLNANNGTSVVDIRSSKASRPTYPVADIDDSFLDNRLRFSGLL
ncbi:hypothetical protein JAAARDRAFT_205635 [Jaapia argillacea MUCL 33604]|uniref:Uncharacterized protein n=1 Tax=Jaapia argillacea MUCL 33604 TaxID=933084 RepID=A0A067PY30_9AGAM|nr:hypothetical protein JAAARDRAFT_205635 [Jaapia argillacea MUCL 33604]